MFLLLCGAFFSLFLFSTHAYGDQANYSIQMKEFIVPISPTPSSLSLSLPVGNPYSTCGGRVNLNGNPSGKNFGDPNCSFTTNGLANLLNQLDPLNAFFWYNTVARNESSYLPNVWVHCSPSGCTPDPGGAWGLFQMGSSSPPVQPPNVPGAFHNNVYDRGDVQWQIQALKAVSENCLLYKQGTEWSYWQTAESRKNHNVYDSNCKAYVPGY